MSLSVEAGGPGTWVLRDGIEQTIAQVDGNAPKLTVEIRRPGGDPILACRGGHRESARGRRCHGGCRGDRAGDAAVTDSGSGRQAAGQGRRQGRRRTDADRARSDEDGERAARPARRHTVRAPVRRGRARRGGTGPGDHRVISGHAPGAGAGLVVGAGRPRARGAACRARRPGPRPPPRRRPCPPPTTASASAPGTRAGWATRAVPWDRATASASAVTTNGGS